MTAAKMFYLHIPKTGGQTLATRLASAFPAQQSVILQHEFGAEERSAFLDLIADKSFVEAHVRGELLQGVDGLDIIATVREPVSQMISSYRHMRRDPANRWARAARKLAPEAFFEQFGDFFTNHQTRYLLSAFSPLGFEIERLGMTRALHARFFEALDRIRWLVPTEDIDEFTRLWALENKYPVADLGSRDERRRERRRLRHASAVLSSRPPAFVRVRRPTASGDVRSVRRIPRRCSCGAGGIAVSRQFSSRVRGQGHGNLVGEELLRARSGREQDPLVVWPDDTKPDPDSPSGGAKGSLLRRQCRQWHQPRADRVVRWRRVSKRSPSACCAARTR